MSRSEFLSRAAARFLEELDVNSQTHQIDLAVQANAEDDDSANDAVAVSLRLLAGSMDEW
ncbi:MAG: hypothetical protein ACYCST_05105 [Acidimicrobiales bacterium]